MPQLSRPLAGLAPQSAQPAARTRLPAVPRLPQALLLPLAALGLLGSGCQTAPGSSATQQRIVEELQAAATATPARKTPDNVMRALVAPPPADKAPRTRRPEPRFDLVFNNAPANQVFDAIASGSRFSFVLPPNQGSAPAVSVNLKDVTAADALEVLREMYGFEYRVSGNRVYVQPAALQTRIYQVAYPSAKRVGSSDTRVSSGSIVNSAGSGSGNAGTATAMGSMAEGSEVTTSTSTDFWKELETSLKAIVGTEAGRQVVVSQHSGVIVARAMPKELREIGDFLRSSKLAVERQVMLEAKIVEVTLNEGSERGINWAALKDGNHRASMGADTTLVNVAGSIGRNYGFQDGSITTLVDNSTTPPTVTMTTMGQLVTSPATSAASGLLGMAFSTNSFFGLMSFLESQGAVQVLSSPRVAAINNQKAVLRVGTDDFYITNISTTVTTSGTGTVATPNITLQPFFSGISLDVTPQIDDDGMVTMHVRPSVSTVSERTRLVNLGNLGSFQLPLASSSVNETDTVVRVSDGNIVAIGGLMAQSSTDSRAEVPGLGRVPVVGSFFKRSSRGVEKRELVFLIRPTVVKDEADWRADLARAEGRMKDMALPPRPLREQLLGE